MTSLLESTNAKLNFPSLATSCWTGIVDTRHREEEADHSLLDSQPSNKQHITIPFIVCVCVCVLGALFVSPTILLGISSRQDLDGVERNTSAMPVRQGTASEHLVFGQIISLVNINGEHKFAILSDAVGLESSPTRYGAGYEVFQDFVFTYVESELKPMLACFFVEVVFVDHADTLEVVIN